MFRNNDLMFRNINVPLPHASFLSWDTSLQAAQVSSRDAAVSKARWPHL